MKKVILGFVLSMMYGVSAQARAAFVVDPEGNLVDVRKNDGLTAEEVEVLKNVDELVAPSAEGITAAEADMAVNAIEVTISSPAFYETPLVIGGMIFAVLLIGFVLFLKRRK